MPRRQRPSLSSPSYGALTGSINWARGMDESLARPVSYAPPVQAESSTSATTTTSNASRNQPSVATSYGKYFGGRRPYRNIEQDF